MVIKFNQSLSTYHPPWRVSVNPKRESRSTLTRMPTMPSPCGVTTWPRITDTRLRRTTTNTMICDDLKNEHKKKQRQQNDIGLVLFSNSIGLVGICD